MKNVEGLKASLWNRLRLTEKFFQYVKIRRWKEHTRKLLILEIKFRLKLFLFFWKFLKDNINFSEIYRKYNIDFSKFLSPFSQNYGSSFGTWKKKHTKTFFFTRFWTNHSYLLREERNINYYFCEILETVNLTRSRNRIK